MIFVISNPNSMTPAALAKLQSSNAPERKLARTIAQIEAKAVRNVANKQKAILKAKRQPRRKDGKFADIQSNPLVSFLYPMSDGNLLHRTVRLISATHLHFTGLELQPGGLWKYKKYLLAKAKEITVMTIEKMS